MTARRLRRDASARRRASRGHRLGGGAAQRGNGMYPWGVESEWDRVGGSGERGGGGWCKWQGEDSGRGVYLYSEEVRLRFGGNWTRCFVRSRLFSLGFLSGFYKFKS